MQTMRREPVAVPVELAAVEAGRSLPEPVAGGYVATREPQGLGSTWATVQRWNSACSLPIVVVVAAS